MNTAARKFAGSYREEVSLSNGLRLVFRLINPNDQKRLERHFAGLSLESRYSRFLAAKSALTPAELIYFTNPDGERHFGLVAVRADDPEQIVGVARFIGDPEHPEQAEPALAVIDTMQNLGIGHLLLERLGEAAIERGIKHFAYSVFANNGPVRTLVRRLAPNTRTEQVSSPMELDSPLGDAPPSS